MPSLAARHVEAEVLDHLAPQDSRARASRRDLSRINTLMFAPRILARLLSRHAPEPPRRILEIGCGDGRMSLALAGRLARRWPGVALTLLDQQAGLVTDQTRAAFSALGWEVDVVSADAFDYLAGNPPHFDIALANLVLHHFEDEMLARLLAGLGRHAALVVAAEPLRRPFALAASRTLAVIGANDVTRHDAPASVRAGFRTGELGALWPATFGPVLEDRACGPFSHVFAASGEARREP
ncbi:class I SAM-dependent methyltransferase [Acuticoccus sp. MNP-M23]|uniref:class I SAM-dependent methyltransferase n=1 Tax=Acuticoccus sp. MNP-M23 TaxID=3072793 RepID=UPI00281569E7|nr:class I SAM-dependent methyltransferase [Acuticoccus sp. MNP-M23]WMS41987.1 class I SAM-dependent methyltransferase [Acuticoccus sp. MNP-M23]